MRRSAVGSEGAPPLDSTYRVLRPDPAGTIESLAALGYSPEAAIADLIDNSIAAGAKSIQITCHWGGSAGSWVALCDDGKGMSESDLLRGLTVGGGGADARADSDLGRFGMGLKTASFSQARTLVVASRTGKGAWNVGTWDTEHVKAVGDWELLIGAPREAADILDRLQNEQGAAGTIVLWLGLRHLAPAGADSSDEFAQRDFYAGVNRVQEHLGMVFHRYLSGRGRVSINLNGEPVPGWDPFLARRKFVEELPSDPSPSGLAAQGFVLPHRARLTDEEYLAAGGPRGWLDQQGFYVYRKNRLIVAGDWLLPEFRKDEKHVLARIAVELPAEHDLAWSLDVKKSSATPPATAVRQLRRVGKATRARAGSVMNHRGKVVRDRQTVSEDFTWQAMRQFGRTRFVVNRQHPLIKDLADRHPEIRRGLGAILSMIESALPVGLIHTTADTGDQSVVDPDGTVPDEVIDLARRMLEVLLNRGEKASAALARVTRMPPFDEHQGLAELLSGNTDPRTDGDDS
ncbi:ATP-binding protein [Geodermatophilus poikilotrophus]|uniref:Histidine kinase-, DNA gyrase B-, and HSP90-like ATPase n=1 Tax=Geodermatophilus poikilotrophus TaxID=1333667 RepID=A0A1I0CQF1_9ACTN|nr:ATP-binding protein [Geodermatophilus poikilotrophus]SET21859.1 Histidine kinase-, DNA gyrase B-, and HSP90-like ATPase [Geodermatophilus poikilotrophus]